jgi:hypothetical protein
MPVGSQKILAELVEHIGRKQTLYQSAYRADLARVREIHGEAMLAQVLDALDAHRVSGKPDVRFRG